MLMASHLAGVGQASGTGVGLVHALGHSIGTRGRSPTGRRSRPCSPRSCGSTSGTRDRELALVGIALGVASAAEHEATAAGAAIGAIDQLLRDVDQRPTLRRPRPGRRRRDRPARHRRHRRRRDPQLPPRLPSAEEARAILVSVPG